MPTTYTHYRFGKDVLRELPEPLKNAIERNRQLFDIGLHGPDILFYYRLLFPNKVTKTGYGLHDRPADVFFRRAARVIGEAEDKAAARAYIYGVICHFALDSQCHKYVQKIMQEGNLSHSEIEMELDRHLLTEDGIEPVSYLTTGHVCPSLKNARVIAPFYRGIHVRQVKEALSSMIVVHKLLLAPKLWKRKILFCVMKLTGLYGKGKGMVMSLSPNPACQKYVILLQKKYEEAVLEAVELILNYQKVLLYKDELSPRFKETFGKGEDWEKLEL